MERGCQAPDPLPAWSWTFRGGSHPGSLPIVVFVADGGGLTGLQGAVGSWLRGPAGLSAGGSLGWQALPSPTWCHSTKAGLGILACPHSLGPSFLLCCSCPTGSDRLGDFALNWLASPLRCPSAHSLYGEGTEPLAASDRNHSDRGHGEGRVGLAHGAGPLCPELSQRPSWALWTGAKLGRVWGCPCRGPVPDAQPGSPSPSHSVRLWAGCQLWLHPGQQVAPLGIAITHFSTNLPGQTLARPSLGPSACPLEGGPGRPGLVPAPAIIRHGSGEDSRCSWPVPQAWPLWKVSGQGNPPMGAEVEGNSKLGADGVHATPAMGAVRPLERKRGLQTRRLLFRPE